VAWATVAAALLAACAEGEAVSSGTTAADTTTTMPSGHTDHEIDRQDRSAAMLAAASFQDVGAAEAAGYKSSLDTLGCFQDPERGGMGVHYVNDTLMDDKLEITRPEALVYELDRDGRITGLVAHEYIVPVDAWKQPEPPRLFGVDLHQHPTLPLWVLHTWLWKDNPNGVFEDWNPAVRLCPAGVPIFGEELPAPGLPSVTRS
jgi:hypothetical protein